MPKRSEDRPRHQYRRVVCHPGSVAARPDRRSDPGTTYDPVFRGDLWGTRADALATKLSRYIETPDVEAFLRRYESLGERIEAADDIRASRDPDDDKSLALAVAGHADCIVTGDSDLIALHPFRSIEILTVEGFIARYPAE